MNAVVPTVLILLAIAAFVAAGCFLAWLPDKEDKGYRHIACLQHTAQMERELYGEVLSDSVGDQALPFDPDPDLITGTFTRRPAPPRGRGSASPPPPPPPPYRPGGFMEAHGNPRLLNPQLRNWSKPNHGGIPVAQEWAKTEGGWPFGKPFRWLGNLLCRIIAGPDDGYVYTPFPPHIPAEAAYWQSHETPDAAWARCQAEANEPINRPDPFKDEKR